MTSKSNPRAIVAGGGLVGSLLAIYLFNRGHKVSIYEKRSDIREATGDAGKSINLIVTSRGIYALKNAGGTLYKDVMKITVPVFGRMMHSLEGETTYQPYGKDESECNYSISRAELNKTLLDYAENLGVKIHFDCEIEAIDAASKSMKFSNDLSPVSYDQLYGTDGAGSVVRNQMIKNMPSDKCTESTDFLNSDYKELFMPALPDGSYAMEKNALHIWPRGTHMLMALPNGDGSFTMTLYLPKNGEAMSFEALKTSKDVEAFFESQFPDAISKMPHYLSDYNANPQGILGTVRSNPWFLNDSIVLLGDAAHAVVPFFGQGMNSGFEDVTVLNNFLELEEDQFDKAFYAYDKEQRMNGNAIADMAIENFIEMRDKVGDEKFLLKKSVEHKLEHTFPSLYRSRYALVIYSLLPYCEAKAIGILQQSILSDLCENLDSVDELDLDKAEKLIQEKLVPYMKDKSINLAQAFDY